MQEKRTGTVRTEVNREKKIYVKTASEEEFRSIIPDLLRRTENGSANTTEMKSLIKENVDFDPSVTAEDSETRPGEQKWEQLPRNIVSHTGEQHKVPGTNIYRREEGFYIVRGFSKPYKEQARYFLDEDDANAHEEKISKRLEVYKSGLTVISAEPVPVETYQQTLFGGEEPVQPAKTARSPKKKAIETISEPIKPVAASKKKEPAGKAKKAVVHKKKASAVPRPKLTMDSDEAINRALVHHKPKRAKTNTSQNTKKRPRQVSPQKREMGIIGKCGELWVVKNEKEMLAEKYGSTHPVLNDVYRVSEEDDAAGYDICSRPVKNIRARKYIEVKSTKNGRIDPDHFSSNELEFIHQHENDANYYVVFAVNPTFNEDADEDERYTDFELHYVSFSKLLETFEIKEEHVTKCLYHLERRENS